MNKKKEIQRMSEIIADAYLPNNRPQSSFDVFRFKPAAEALSKAGYGNVKQAVKEFAEELKRRFIKHYPTGYKDAIYQFTDIEIDELLKERFEE